MNNAMGGVTNVVIISVFIALISGYMAFNANYTKAFRLKNKVISAIEEYEGDLENDDFQEKVVAYMDQLGYNNPKNNNNSGCEGPFKERGLCIKQVDASNEDSNAAYKDYTRAYFRVSTSISIDVIFVRDLMNNFNTFTISGDTKLLEVAKK